MISNKAIVDKDGNVINVIVYDDESDWTPPEGTFLVDVSDGAEPGARYDFKTRSFIRVEPETKITNIEEEIKELERELSRLEAEIGKFKR